MDVYITTPIYYVNGLPHIGHAYTTIAADALTRWHRLKGDKAFFLTGTDEHGQKVLEKAAERGMAPTEHCDDMVQHWRELWFRLGINPSRFIRTTDLDHQKVVQDSLQTLGRAGRIYFAEYEGWYYTPDEAFVTDKDVEEGKYDKTKLVRLKEGNYFFKMSLYQEDILAHIEANPNFIQPDMRRNEVLGFLRKDLGDLCISRPKARMGWGIEIPFDANYVTYVWFDALLNYLTGIGWHPDPNKCVEGWAAKWHSSTHLLGKDILTTHAVYWSAMLLALGVPLPKRLVAHGWWVANDGSKMGKSKGNAIDVGLLIDSYGADATRYFFLREVAFGADGGFSYEKFQTRFNTDLANDLGNLSHRCLSMVHNWLGAKVPEMDELTDADLVMLQVAATSVRGFVAGMEAVQFSLALKHLWEIIRAGNKYVDTEAPWKLNKAKDVARLSTVLRIVLEVLAIAGALLLPVMPEKAHALLQRMSSHEHFVQTWLPRLLEEAAQNRVGFDKLETGAPIVYEHPLFERHTEFPPEIAEAARKA